MEEDVLRMEARGLVRGSVKEANKKEGAEVQQQQQQENVGRTHSILKLGGRGSKSPGITR